jgi:hypothetical protein
MAKRKSMTETELSSLLDGQIADAVSYEDSELAKQREKAIKYYEGTMDDLPAEAGKSSVVSRDVADTLGWVMPGLMRVFLASDKVADFQPVGDEDEQFAKDATDGVNFLFLERCDGYRVLRSGCWDGLLQGNGILKHWWDSSPEYKVENLSGLSDDLFHDLVKDDDVEVLEHTAYADPQGTYAAASPIAAAAGSPVAPGLYGEAGGVPGDPAAGQLLPPAGTGVPVAGGPVPAGAVLPAGELAPQAPQLHDVKIKRTCRTGKLAVWALPNEEFLIERSATVLDETVRFCAHLSFPTRSELIKRGLPRDKVDALPAHAGALDEAAKSARDKLSSWNTDAPVDKSVERVKIYECYVLCDYDGDGVAERWQVITGDIAGRGSDKEGRPILSMEEWGDDLPFTDIVPDPVPHRWRGRSIFDEMEDIQRVKTVLMRQTLDNLYLSNNPQRAANLTRINNPDELITPTIGGVIDTNGDPQSLIMDMAIPFVAEKTFGVLGYMDEVAGKRVGQVSFGLDPETLQNQTATATQAQQSASTSKVELYARNIAEMGLKRLFKCLLKLVVKHQDQPFWIRRQGKPIKMDPRGWNVDMDVSINVGLGAGSRDRDMMMLQGIAGKQEMILQLLGPDNPLAPMDKYSKTLGKMVEVGGLRSPELFFGDLDEDAVKEWLANKSQNQQPDPKQQELQMKAQIEQQKMQQAAQLEQQKLQMSAEIEKVQAQADIATQQQKTQAEMALAERRFQLDREMKLLDAQLKREEHQANLQFRQAEHEANLRFRTQDQQVAHHYKEQDFALKAKQSQTNKAADPV